MKVKATNHLIQTIGSIQVERVIGTVFDLPENDAVAAHAAGVVEIIETKPQLQNANNRKTKVVKMETK
jgi:hypothetical protein